MSQDFGKPQQSRQSTSLMCFVRSVDIFAQSHLWPHEAFTVDIFAQSPLRPQEAFTEHISIVLNDYVLSAAPSFATQIYVPQSHYNKFATGRR